jgi:hypothetical protein
VPGICPVATGQKGEETGKGGINREVTKATSKLLILGVFLLF